MSIDRNLCTGTRNPWAFLFRLTFLRACKAAKAWVIRSSTSAYASGILVGVGDGVKMVGQKIDVLGYVIVQYQAREARQAEWAKVWGTDNRDQLPIYTYS